MISLMRKSRDERRVICDVCGQAYRLKDVIKINDKNNRQYGLVVCKFDLDPTNPHDIPFKIKETILVSPEMVRDRPPPIFVSNPLDDRLPGPPRNGFATLDMLSGYIIARWEGPTDNGSSAITGYVVQRASPQTATFFTRESDTGTSAGYYIDTDASLSGEHAYKVAAINGFGTGPFSEIFYYPTILAVPATPYLVRSQDGYTIQTGDGKYILLSQIVA